MVKSGMVFVYDGKTAQTLNYLPNLDLWVCRYCDGSNLVFLFTKEIEERTKKDMKLEYKFYEKNLAPKWLEGDYDLHIEGNRMTMTSKDGKKVEARCHPEDDWRLQIGIDELKDRMIEKTKPIEPIKLGNKVKFKTGCADWYIPHTMQSWCENVKLPDRYLFEAYRTREIYIDDDDYDEKLEKFDFVVMYVGKMSIFSDTYAYIRNTEKQIGFIVNTNWLEAVK